MSWQGLAGVCVVPPIVYFVMMFFTKESPSFLLSKGKYDEAKVALQYYRGKKKQKKHSCSSFALIILFIKFYSL